MHAKRLIGVGLAMALSALCGNGLAYTYFADGYEPRMPVAATAFLLPGGVSGQVVESIVETVPPAQGSVEVPRDRASAVMLYDPGSDRILAMTWNAGDPMEFSRARAAEALVLGNPLLPALTPQRARQMFAALRADHAAKFASIETALATNADPEFLTEPAADALADLWLAALEHLATRAWGKDFRAAGSNKEIRGIGGGELLALDVDEARYTVRSRAFLDIGIREHVLPGSSYPGGLASVSPPYLSSSFRFASGQWLGTSSIPGWAMDRFVAIDFGSFSGTEAQLLENARLYEATNGRNTAFSAEENANVIVSNLVKVIAEPVLALLGRSGGALGGDCKEELAANLYAFVNSRVGVIQDATAGAASHAALTQILFEGLQNALTTSSSCLIGDAARRKAYQLAIKMSLRFGLRFVPFVGHVALAQDSAEIGLSLGNAVARIAGLAGDYSDRLLVQAEEASCSPGAMVDDELLACFEDEALRQCVESQWGGRQIVEAYHLTCVGQGVSTLAGIDQLIDLRHLYLSNNQIADVSVLAQVTTLRDLELSNNQISDVSALGTLPVLRDLGLWSNRITNVDALGSLKALTRLGLGNNQISSVNGLGNLTGLLALYLPGNRLSGADALQGLAGLEALLLLDLSNSQITDVGSLGGLTTLNFLLLSNNSITDISALRHLVALTGGNFHYMGSGRTHPGLDLGFNQIVDVSALGSLVNLDSLVLHSNQIVDVTALGSLANLNTLDLDGNRIADVSALGSLGSLSALSLGNNQIVDVSALGSLTTLETLQLWSNRIVDVSALAGMTGLKYLRLSDNQIVDASALGNLSNLTWLLLSNNRISEVDGLGGLDALNYLYLDGNRIADVDALGDLSGLLWLVLNYNRITDISALSGLTSLTWLALEGNAITDISPIGGLTSLSTLGLANNSIPDVGPSYSCDSYVELRQILPATYFDTNTNYVACNCDCPCGPRYGLAYTSQGGAAPGNDCEVNRRCLVCR